MNARGFTILEILVVISVVAVLMGISIPRIQGMQTEGNILKAKREVKALQAAVESYRSHHTNTNPTNITTDLTGASPQMITSALTDPFSGNGYLFTPSANGQYYVIRSVGPNDIDETTTPLATGAVSVAGDDLAVSNGQITIAGLIADTASCAQDADCASGACGGYPSVCRPTGNKTLGAACGGHSQCQSSYCGYDVDWNVVCTDGTLHSNCSDSAMCQDGYCETYYGQCSEGADGSVCADNSQCQSGYCDTLWTNRCQPGPLYTTCATGADCTSGYCDTRIAGICTSGALGKSCGSDDDCASGHCDGDSGVCSDGVIGGLGSACNDNSDCQEGDCRSNNVCTNGTTGFPCSYIVDCANGYYCVNWYCSPTPGPLGSLVLDAASCASGKMADYSCRDRRGEIGDGCWYGTDCASGNCSQNPWGNCIP